MLTKTKLIKNAVVIATLFSTALSTTSLALSAESEVIAELKTTVKTSAESSVANNEVSMTTSNVESHTAEKKADDSKRELMAILAKIEFFSAEFNQQIFDEAGNKLQQGSGLLAVSKPNLVNWQTIMPDESLIVSDGKNLWFYDPFVEQVSVYTLESAIANTPILLITSNDEQLWQDYSVKQLTDNRYLISANNENARVKSLELSFVQKLNHLELAAFNILDATGQLSVITLTHQDKAPKANLFTFSVPEGVYLDDQR
ncbi:outer membrane lipoprotein chaperone LolA [Colwellia sp. MB02u-18]|uniref:outer membrane lipoprotein chaperone LolA n=1 Tax=unclassified Colwellia TaxID=196834 RepID=UPI0015F64A34|nr:MULTISPECIES: outer membrane lipoprotein chaperone LolA [unclassified Colwellia]MBA6225250.1 outer membrane lipoprotein chaperone LolA [Colwellia sp. MB3u-45]MBA6266281.1 outer membrane lipoprotein chaperone LolA [Colwellia sp. MB3u-43]MBA6322912.1 outer membrane lipoprotein chaperone LolA [Colwellia sp. MB02u-19]MBA6324680.1 outer membrane lipoprotein chaperone LolA [Colwellia sp. MB02u-18]MBA6331129.1 outer membrane lipoprotein chaperone LolA [Colwellia sp. MB02u-12]